MNAPLRFDADALRPMEVHQIVARYTLSALWQGKWFIAAIVTLCLLVAVGGAALTPPYYTSEAILQLSFSREEPAGSSHRVVPTLDASTMMESAVRLIRSRAIASAVVTRLGLENSPELTRRPRLSNAWLWLKTESGIASVPPTKHDLAGAGLMQRLRVEIQGRSYLLSIITTSNAPAEASALANAVATEYLRTTAMREVGQQVFDAQAELMAWPTSMANATPTSSAVRCNSKGYVSAWMPCPMQTRPGNHSKCGRRPDSHSCEPGPGSFRTER